MNWNLFFKVWCVGALFVIAQGVASYADGFFSQRQMLQKGIVGYSFVQHGGMWADFFLLSSMIALLVSCYDLHYFSKWSLTILFLAVIIPLIAGIFYRQMGSVIPEAHTHNGITTIAGRIHGVYAVLAIWVIILFVFTPVSPRPSVQHLIMLASALTLVFIFGVIKFNPMWKCSKEAAWQVIVATCSVWAIVGVKLLHK
jgi:hypothetical protein